MKFNYYIPTRLIFGNGSLNELHKQTFPGKKAFIVTSGGSSMKKYGYLDRVIEQLDMAGIGYQVFAKILPNPILSHVTEGAKLIKETGCDFVIGLGGGSSIDSGKAMAILANNPGDYWDYINGGSGKGLPVPNDPLPVIAITTTAGTGTEADPWTVITKEDTDEKIGGGYDKTFPVFSIIDPELMLTVPPALTAYQGFDALYHSTEGYLNNTSYVMSDMYALKSLELIGKYLCRAVTDGNDIEAREMVALANTLAGMVESTSGCTSEHSLEHALSAVHPEITHGAGLNMVSEAYYTFFAEKGIASDRFVDMARALGDRDASQPMDFVRALVQLQKDCNVYGLKMSDYGITYDDMKLYADKALSTMGGLFEVDPAPLTPEDTLGILQASFK